MPKFKTVAHKDQALVNIVKTCLESFVLTGDTHFVEIAGGSFKELYERTIFNRTDPAKAIHS